MENNDLNKLCQAVWGEGEYLVHIKTDLDEMRWFGSVNSGDDGALIAVDGEDPVDVKNKLDLRVREKGRELLERSQKTIESLRGLIGEDEGSEVRSISGSMISIDWNSLESIYKKDGKIPAIKEYRTITGMGLKEAKEAIEDRFEKDDSKFKKWWVSNLNGCSRGEAEKILILLQEGKIINAVKYYREISGAPLKDAKDVIEGITERMRRVQDDGFIGYDLP